LTEVIAEKRASKAINEKRKEFILIICF